MERKLKERRSPLLIIFAGLPGTGKTALARELARELDAVYLRIDSIEQAILHSRAAGESIYDAGYGVAYAVAEDNLRLGLTVVADSVNPLPLTRDAWVGIAHRAHVTPVEIEVSCSDTEQHRKRIETRVPDIPGHKLPTWQEVVSREYHPWNRERVVVDTAGHSISQNMAQLREALGKRMNPPRSS